MTSSDGALYTVVIAEGQEPFLFGNERELIDWLKAQIEPLDWIRTEARGFYANSDQFNQSLRVALASAQKCAGASEGPTDQLRSEVAHALNAIERDRHRLLATSPEGKFVLGLHQSRGREVAGAAALHFMNVAPSSHGEVSYNGALVPLPPSLIEGMVRAIAYRLGYDIAAEHARGRFEEVHDQASNLVSRTERELDQWRKRGDRTERAINRMLGLFRKQRDQEHGRQNSRFEKNIEDATARLNGLEDLYKEKLALLAPVKYWGKRKIVQNCLAGLWAAFFIASAGFGAWYILPLWNETLEQVLGSENPQYWMLGKVILVAGLLAYLLRLLARLAMSSLHIAADAAERAVMVQTYLSLLHGEHINNDADRQLILQSLFRPGTTGLIKDVQAALPPVKVTAST